MTENKYLKAIYETKESRIEDIDIVPFFREVGKALTKDKALFSFFVKESGNCAWLSIRNDEVIERNKSDAMILCHRDDLRGKDIIAGPPIKKYRD